MKLFGVEHGSQKLFGGLPIAENLVEHDEAMLAQIRDLPAGSRVGIEDLPEFHDPYNQYGLLVSTEQQMYWGTIMAVCEGARHDLVYLDELKPYLRLGELTIARTTLRRQVGKQLAPDETRDLNERDFALWVEARRLFTLEREELIYRNIGKSALDLAIIGIAHGDFLVLSLDKQLEYSIRVDEYWRAVSTHRQSRHLAPEVIGQKFSQSKPDPRVLKANQMLLRTYRAAEQGRILPNRQPSWIGSWRPDCRPVGLFEIYPSIKNGSKVHGQIEDCLGTATFKGEFSRDEAVFVKEYDLDSLLEEKHLVDMGPITYHGYRVSDGDYHGNYESDNGKGQFILRSGSKLYEPLLPLEPTLF